MTMEQLKEILSIPFTLPIVAVTGVFLWLIVKAIVDGIARSNEHGLRYKFLNKAVEKGALRPEDLQALLDPERSKFASKSGSSATGGSSDAAFAAATQAAREAAETKDPAGVLSAAERIVLERERSFRSGVTLLTLAGGFALGYYFVQSVFLIFAAVILGSIAVGQISYAMARREVIHRIREDVERSTPS